jgi:methionine-gamma-lyase
VRPLYGGSDHLLDSGLLGTEVTFCGPADIAAAIRPDTGLVVIESPGNPSLQLVDIADVVRQAGTVPVLVDNTFATPILQNPLALGASYALHSATKYLGGHGDVIGGVIACSEERAEGLRRVRAITGALLHPLGAYLLHRGLATLPLRMRAQQATAARVAAWLGTRDEIAQVCYPGLDGDPRGLLGTQLRGTGAMISVRLRDGFDAAKAFTSGVRMFTHAVSLGGVESLLQHPAALTHRPVAAEGKPDLALVRLSIGLEGHDDLIADLERGLAATHDVRGLHEVAH